MDSPRVALLMSHRRNEGVFGGLQDPCWFLWGICEERKSLLGKRLRGTEIAQWLLLRYAAGQQTNPIAFVEGIQMNHRTESK